MLGEDLNYQVQAYLLELAKVGGVVNREIAIASARGIVCKKDSRMLAENGGHVLLIKDWAHYLLLQKKYNFLCEIKGIIMMEPLF